MPRLGTSEARHLHFDITYWRVAELCTVASLPLRLIRIASVGFNRSHLIKQIGPITFINVTYICLFRKSVSYASSVIIRQFYIYASSIATEQERTVLSW